MTVLQIKWLALFIVLLVTVLAAWLPFKKRLLAHGKTDFLIGEAFAVGIFLGVGLIHMLSKAGDEFQAQHYHYPFALLLAGSLFLLLLWVEHLGRELYQQHGEDGQAFAILAVFFLSFHSFLTGAALGLSMHYPLVIMMIIAIVAHKWAASFALAVEINKSNMRLRKGIIAFSVFALMTPLGIIFGEVVTTHLQHYTLLEPVFTSLAAGTFIYLGTLHGLERAVMIRRCCNLRHYSFVILGFAIMAVLAIWL